MLSKRGNFGLITLCCRRASSSPLCTNLEPSLKIDSNQRPVPYRLYEKSLSGRLSQIGRGRPLIEEEPLVGWPQQLTASNSLRLLRDIDTFIFDADGVLWLGGNPIHGAAEFIQNLLAQGKRVIVLTNNATKSRARFHERLRAMNFPEQLTHEALVNPAIVLSDLLVRSGLHQSKKKVYLIGEQGIRDELKAAGIEFFGHGAEKIPENAQVHEYRLDLEEKPEDVGAVVVGYERHFNYEKLMKAANYLRSEETLFIATNEDETCPSPDPDLLIPDAGPIVAAVRCAAGRDPITVGKPNSASFNYICRRWKINPSRTLMVGDRLNTDVLFGRKHGLKTLLVLSGCHQLEDIRKEVERGIASLVPDLFGSSLGALLPKERSLPLWSKKSINQLEEA